MTFAAKAGQIFSSSSSRDKKESRREWKIKPDKEKEEKQNKALNRFQAFGIDVVVNRSYSSNN